MSGFPAIRPGLKLKPVGKQGLMSRNQANTVLAVCNGVLNSKLIDTDSDEFHITPNNAVYGIGRGQVSSPQSTAMRPFRLYATGETDVSGHKGYNVRIGIVEIRCKFHIYPNGPNNWFPGNGVSTSSYQDYVIPTNVDATVSLPPDASDVIMPAKFFLDPTPEVVGGVNYGAYYSFWINIQADTDNGGAYNGVVQISSQRFTSGAPGSIYSTAIFPGAGGGVENLPIAFVQLTPATSPILNSSSGNTGLVYQMIHDNYINNYRGGLNGISGPLCFQGDWSDPGNSSGNRVWWPNDLITYDTGTPLDFNNGFYLWAGPRGHLGGTPSNPNDGAAQWVHWPDGR